MSSPDSAPEEPRPGQLVFHTVFLLMYATGISRSDRPWQFWLCVALSALAIWVIAGWLRDWGRHRAWVRSQEPDRPPKR